MNIAMSYFRGDHYVWSDGDCLHLWSAAPYEPANDHYAAGVSMPEALMDQFAVMRFAELVWLGRADAAITDALQVMNFGGDALRARADDIRRLVAALEQARSDTNGTKD